MSTEKPTNTENFWNDLALTDDYELSPRKTKDMGVLNEFEKNDNLIGGDAKFVFGSDPTKAAAADPLREKAKTVAGETFTADNLFASDQINDPTQKSGAAPTETDVAPPSLGSSGQDRPASVQIQEQPPGNQDVFKPQRASRGNPTEGSGSVPDQGSPAPDQAPAEIRFRFPPDYKFEKKQPEPAVFLPPVNMTEILSNINQIGNGTTDEPKRHNQELNVVGPRNEAPDAGFRTMKLMQNIYAPEQKQTQPRQADTKRTQDVKPEKEQRPRKLNLRLTKNFWRHAVYFAAWLIVFILLIAILVKP